MKPWFVLAVLAFVSPAAAFHEDRLAAAARAEETGLPARLGAAVLDTGTGQLWRYNADARFPFDSTHKAFACAALLAKADKGEAALDRRVSIAKGDLVAYSPVIEKKVAPDTVSLAEACAAALAVSDNSAANLVLAALGGPGGVTAFLRGLGDATSRLDRTEPDLNEATPGDPRDTTTPAAAVANLDNILLKDALKPDSRAQLTQWMEGDRVAGSLLRKSLPPGWRIADKTGAGGHGSRGIVAVLWPPGHAPLVAAIYLTDTAAPRAAQDAAIARIGAALVGALAP
jgi:beta-lactamase class A